jgi:hypothetical protein
MKNEVRDETLPTVVSQIGVTSPPRIDSTGEELKCTTPGRNGTEKLVNSSIEVTFWESDYTWLIFYSHPVYVRCYEGIASADAAFVIQVTRLANSTLITSSSGSNDVKEPVVALTSRIALMNNCTRGTNPSHCVRAQPSNQTEWGKLLHKHSRVFPGKHTKIDYTFFSEEEKNGGEFAFLQYDWDARHVADLNRVKDHGSDLLMYSLVRIKMFVFWDCDAVHCFTYNLLHYISPLAAP